MTRQPPSLIKQALFLAAIRLQQEHGWNQPDKLLFLVNDDRSFEVSFLHEKPLPVDVRSSLFLRKLAELARKNPKIVESFGTKMPTMYGLGLITEGELTPAVSPEDWAGRSKIDDWEDHPGLRPCRMITVIDLYGQVFNVEHILGEMPAVHQQGDLSDDEIVGTPVEGLRQLLIEILKTMPPEQERIEAIERLTEMLVPNTEEVLAALKIRESYADRPCTPILPLPDYKEDDR